MAPKTKTFKFRGTRYDARWVNQVHPEGIMVLDEQQLCPEIRMDRPGLQVADKHILDVKNIRVVLKKPFLYELRFSHVNKGGWTLRQLFDVIEEDFRFCLHHQRIEEGDSSYRLEYNYAITDLFYLMQAKITFGLDNLVNCTIESVV